LLVGVVWGGVSAPGALFAVGVIAARPVPVELIDPMELLFLSAPPAMSALAAVRPPVGRWPYAYRGGNDLQDKP
jgi:hypothetical protein